MSFLRTASLGSHPHSDLDFVSLLHLCISYPYTVQLEFCSQQFLLSTRLYLEGSLGLLAFRAETPLHYHHQILSPEEHPPCFDFGFQIGPPQFLVHICGQFGCSLVQRTIRGFSGVFQHRCSYGHVAVRIGSWGHLAT